MFHKHTQQSGQHGSRRQDDEPVAQWSGIEKLDMCPKQEPKVPKISDHFDDA
jgi:hypothetical protein